MAWLTDELSEVGDGGFLSDDWIVGRTNFRPVDFSHEFSFPFIRRSWSDDRDAWSEPETAMALSLRRNVIAADGPATVMATVDESDNRFLYSGAPPVPPMRASYRYGIALRATDADNAYVGEWRLVREYNPTLGVEYATGDLFIWKVVAGVWTLLQTHGGYLNLRAYPGRGNIQSRQQISFVHEQVVDAVRFGDSEPHWALTLSVSSNYYFDPFYYWYVNVPGHTIAIEESGLDGELLGIVANDEAVEPYAPCPSVYDRLVWQSTSPSEDAGRRHPVNAIIASANMIPLPNVEADLDNLPSWLEVDQYGRWIVRGQPCTDIGDGMMLIGTMATQSTPRRLIRLNDGDLPYRFGAIAATDRLAIQRGV